MKIAVMRIAWNRYSYLARPREHLEYGFDGSMVDDGEESSTLGGR
jgi:hypothetical protein